jgi:hypothetical protein
MGLRLPAVESNRASPPPQAAREGAYPPCCNLGSAFEVAAFHGTCGDAHHRGGWGGLLLRWQIKTGVADTSLAPFLSKVLPAMEAALQANAASSAFEESDAFADDSQVRRAP